MRFKSSHLFLLATVLAVSACHRTPKAPTGQVAAVVGGREITVRELSTALAAAPPVAPSAQKARQEAALNFIIQRTILANEARKEGLDKDPNFVLLSEQATDGLLVQQLQSKIAAAVPPPSAEEVNQFVNTNPDIFAQRKIFDVEQIRMARPADPNLVKQLQPMKTLDDVAAFLTQNHIAFQRGTSSIDGLGQNLNLVKAIVGLPPGEVFIISAGNQVLINLIHATRIEPFTGDAAQKFAQNYLKAQHTQDAVRKQLGVLLASGQHDVQIAKDYQPVPKPAGKNNVTPPAGKGG